MPRIILFTSILTVLWFNTNAQTKPLDIYSHAAKININYVKNFDDGSTVAGAAPSFMVKNRKKNFHELELSSCSFNRSRTTLYTSTGQLIGPADLSSQDIGFRYQYTITFMKKARLNPQVGISFLNRYQGAKSEPHVVDAYPRISRQWDGRIALCPQVRYNISSRFFADLSLPVDVATFEYKYQEVINPAIPIRQQSNSGFEYESFQGFGDQFHVRVGAGVMF